MKKNSLHKRGVTVVEAFNDVAQRQPDKIAVRIDGTDDCREITYSALAKEAQRVASRLVEAGLKKGEAVILPSIRTPDLCANLLGILWAGGHYVFVDFDYPLQRQHFICSQVGARFGIGSVPDQNGSHLAIEWLEIDRVGDTPAPLPLPDDQGLPAYVMFTSGSTGEPKGVIIPHRGIVRLVKNADFIKFDQNLAFLHHSALSFDASTLEIWGPLLNGGVVVIFNQNSHHTPEALQLCIETCGVNSLWLTSSLYNSLIAESSNSLQRIKQLLIGGEALSVSHVLIGLNKLSETKIFNGYGPTENTTFTCVYPIPKNLSEDTQQIPIGYPVSGTTCEVFDENLVPVDDGQVGELIAFGDGLAIEYLSRPELTAERFVTVTCSDGVDRRGYRTGDMVSRGEDGVYEYHGRIDKQVKIDGHRIEPGEIEYFLNQYEGINEARVVVKTGALNKKRLAGYFVSSVKVDVDRLRKSLSEKFPAFMIPHFLIQLESLPKNINGKLDETSLPDPFQFDTTTKKGDQDNILKRVAKCWSLVLGREVSQQLNFLEAGGTSLEALTLSRRLREEFDLDLSDTFVFEFSSIESQARYLSGTETSTDSDGCDVVGDIRKEIAVVGMACRMPGAASVDEFWENLVNGVESITFFEQDQLSPELDGKLTLDARYIKAKGIITDCDKFDARFFDIPPLEAKVMDPQQRMMLEVAWHALEDAAAGADSDKHRIGVFAGMNWPRYYQQYVLPNQDINSKYGAFNAGLANEADFLATRLSYKLNLKGPSVNVFTACSTGLVAIAQACAAIESGECEMAIAGGVSVSTPLNSGYLYQEGGMLSSDGHCRPFDVEASGTTFNDGVGCIVLKRMELAEKDGDQIYAVVKGYAVNNDGKEKASFTAPSVTGQTDVYKSALRKSGLDPSSIRFIETHGTATPLGDPIEVRSLASVYNDLSDRAVGKCALGSVKSNIGHTIHAAGIASFIKTVKAVETGLIPPTLFFNEPNPKLELEKTRFYVNNKTVTWPEDAKHRTAAVSSLGVGGTNAHVILEEYKKSAGDGPDLADSDESLEFPVLISAKDEDSLSLMIDDYKNYLSGTGKSRSVPSISYTSIVGRKHFDFRALMFARSQMGGSDKESLNRKLYQGRVRKQPINKAVFMFTGQGSQKWGMGQWLYENDDDFRGILNRGFEYLSEFEHLDLKSIMFGDGDESTKRDEINLTEFTQPSLYLYEYALARHLIAKGCQPGYLLGHSIGEFAAAAISGVFSFEDGLKLVVARGRHMQRQQPGKMLAVPGNEETVSYLLNDKFSIAAINSSDQVVLSGDEVSVQSAYESLESNGITATILHTSHAFHSYMMEPVVNELAEIINSVNLSPQQIPIVSTVTGTLLTDSEATSAEYWSTQLRKPVLFDKAMLYLSSEEGSGPKAYIEAGPGRVLSHLAQKRASERDIVLPVTPNSSIDAKSSDDVSKCLATLWINGFGIDWLGSNFKKPPKKTKLPQYRFNEKRYWIDLSDDHDDSIENDKQTIENQSERVQEVKMSPDLHKEKTKERLIELLEEVTGYDLSDMESHKNFSEAGLDSLLLTQAANDIENEYKLGISFRDLMEEYTSLDLLADYIAQNTEPTKDAVQVDTGVPSLASSVTDVDKLLSYTQAGIDTTGSTQQIVQEQLRIMQMQLKVLAGGVGMSTAMSVLQPELVQAGTVDTAESTSKQTKEPQRKDTSPKTKTKPKHTPGTRINKSTSTTEELTNVQKKWIQEVFDKYQQKYSGSKAYTQKHRKYLADPRSVSGFSPECKEIIFPIVTASSKGSKLWDIDGNEFIDTSNGFGPIFFGHSPDFVTNAVKIQMDDGIETGPQSPLAGEVAKLFCEITGNDRCCFASTGSEAVLGALRIARTVSGKGTVVRFDGSYHGIFDEVVSRAGRDYQALPGAPGIPRESLHNMKVLPWGEEESLETLDSMCGDLAAVLVEPVQSRLPEFHDKEYLQKIRKITEEHNVALILDEVVTGFRVAPGGIRERFDIDADIATYGKVIGGGYPIGIIGGKSKYLDALDGGYWEYGDDSIPEAGVTFFAGTFVRHPVALAAAKAILEKIKQEGAVLYQDLEIKTKKMASEAKDFIEKLKCDVKFEEFSSFFYVASPAESHWGYLLFTLMVHEGIHIQQYRPNFLTTTHSDDDIKKILDAFKSSLAQLISIGLIDGDMVAAKNYLNNKSEIPANARLGKNEKGEPAYFVEDSANPGSYIEVGKP